MMEIPMNMTGIPIKNVCSSMCTVHCNKSSLFSGPEKERLISLLEEDVATHEHALGMRATTDAEREVISRDREILQRLVSELKS